MARICKARIIINHFLYECECNAGHTGPHITRIQTAPNVYDGFEWDIDDLGAVIVNSPKEVAAELFRFPHDEPPF